MIRSGCSVVNKEFPIDSIDWVLNEMDCRARKDLYTHLITLTSMDQFKRDNHDAMNLRIRKFMRDISNYARPYLSRSKRKGSIAPYIYVMERRWPLGYWHCHLLTAGLDSKTLKDRKKISWPGHQTDIQEVNDLQTAYQKIGYMTKWFDDSYNDMCIHGL